MAPPPKY
jgi:hypothetical protein